MNKALCYKEWLKVRTCYLCMVALVAAMTAYCLLRIARVIAIKDVSHLWDLMISRDMVFTEAMQYVFPAVGLAVAIAQFLPEVGQKRLKLTLHLPVSHLRTILIMLGFGTGLLVALFALSAATLGVFTREWLAPELVGRILLTLLPWQLGGLAAYYLGAWILTEPTRRLKILGVLLGAAVLRVYYLSDAPESYNGFLPALTVITLSLSSLTALSVQRFKAGAQD